MLAKTHGKNCYLVRPHGKKLAGFTVKLARAKMPANAGNFICSSHVKRPHTQFTCVACSLPVKTGKFTGVEAASISRTIHANCLQAHVYLPEYHGLFTGNFTCGTHANLPATAGKNISNSAKNTRIAGKNARQTQAKITAHAGKRTSNSTQNYLQLQAVCYHTAGKFTCKLQVS